MYVFGVGLGVPRKPAAVNISPAIKDPRLQVIYWPIEKLQPYVRNPRKNDAAVDRMCASINEFGFTSSGEVIDGHLRLKAAVRLAIPEVPVILCDGWTEAQVKAFRLMVNRSVAWAQWDMDALAVEFADLKALDFDLSLTGFDTGEIDRLTLALTGLRWRPSRARMTRQHSPRAQSRGPATCG